MEGVNFVEKKKVRKKQFVMIVDGLNFAQRFAGCFSGDFNR